MYYLFFFFVMIWSDVMDPKLVEGQEKLESLLQALQLTVGRATKVFVCLSCICNNTETVS